MLPLLLTAALASPTAVWHLDDTWLDTRGRVALDPGTVSVPIRDGRAHLDDDTALAVPAQAWPEGGTVTLHTMLRLRREDAQETLLRTGCPDGSCDVVVARESSRVTLTVTRGEDVRVLRSSRALRAGHDHTLAVVVTPDTVRLVVDNYLSELELTTPLALGGGATVGPLDGEVAFVALDDAALADTVAAPPRPSVVGMADLHLHQWAHLSFGRKFLWGAPDAELSACGSVHDRRDRRVHYYDQHGWLGPRANTRAGMFRQGLAADEYDDVLPHPPGGPSADIHEPNFLGWPTSDTIAHQQVWEGRCGSPTTASSSPTTCAVCPRPSRT